MPDKNKSQRKGIFPVKEVVMHTIFNQDDFLLFERRMRLEEKRGVPMNMMNMIWEIFVQHSNRYYYIPIAFIVETKKREKITGTNVLHPNLYNLKIGDVGYKVGWRVTVLRFPRSKIVQGLFELIQHLKLRNILTEPTLTHHSIAILATKGVVLPNISAMVSTHYITSEVFV